jgi:hypothetical protein
MSPQCNIDAKGKAVRLLWGILMLLLAGVVIALQLTDMINGWWWWAIAIFLLASAAFAFYEARAGWCAVRAMGFKTPV